MAIDQAHEQQNAIFKGDGGAIGLTENRTALTRWLLAGPDLARLVGEFEKEIENFSPTSYDHHENGLCPRQVNSLIATISSMGNPFFLKMLNWLHSIPKM
eukprot:Pompholyxophrys_punicea_v1_NODE_82_length_3700_cov_3.100110.p3 type:complete len:100 gc:universal NODE_82_length_3700_cov_3.100110:1367-1068(-)